MTATVKRLDTKAANSSACRRRDAGPVSSASSSAFASATGSLHAISRSRCGPKISLIPPTSVATIGTCAPAASRTM